MWISTRTHSVFGNDNLYVFASKSNGRRFDRGSLVDKSINPQAKNHHMSPRCQNMSQVICWVFSFPSMCFALVKARSNFGEKDTYSWHQLTKNSMWYWYGTDTWFWLFKLGNVSATRQAIPDGPSFHWGDASTAPPQSHSPARWFGTPSLERGTRNQTKPD